MKKLSKIFITIAITTFSLSYVALAQVAINTDGSDPDASAGLDVNFNNKGFLLPRLSVAEIATISSPADGLQVYNTTDRELYIYVAVVGKWKQIGYGMHSLSADCGFPITDVRDGKTYNTVLIGDQCWMAENLNIGDRLDGQDNQFDNGDIEKYCYGDDTLNCDTYGGLYQWGEMMQYVTTEGVQGICPIGWHIPTDDEWKTLEMQLGMTQAEADDLGWRGTDEGGKLKETGSSHWNFPNTGATNLSGFTALPGGSRGSGAFYGLVIYGYWWSGTEDSGPTAWARYLYYNGDEVYRYSDDKTCGYSVRCLKN